MKYFLLFISINFFLVSLISGQLPYRPYEKLQFKNLQPFWYETFFDTSLVNSQSDGYNNLFVSSIVPIVKDSFIYSIAEVLTITNYNEGAILEKRNLESGELIWRILYDLKSIKFNEYPFKMYFGIDGYLYVHGYRKRMNDNSPYPFLFTHNINCRLTFRKIDPESGIILEFYSPNDEDVDAIRVLASYNKSSHFSDIFVLNEGYEFLYWERIVDYSSTPVQKLFFQKFDKFGKELTTKDSIILEGEYNGTINLIPINEDTLIFVNFDVKNQRIIKYSYDYDFNILDSMVLKDVPFYFEHRNFVKLYKDNLFIFSYDIIDLDTHQFSGAIYSCKGELFEHVSIKTEISDSYQLFFDEIREKIVIVNSKYNQNPLSSNIYFYSSKGDGEYDISGVLTTIDSMRIGTCYHLIFVPNNKLVCYLFESSLYLNSNQFLNDPHAKAQSIMILNSNDIGLGIVSAQENLSNECEVKIYPNPGQDYLTFSSEMPVSGTLVMYKISGSIVQQETLTQAKMKIINTEFYSPGFYILVFSESESGKITSIKWIKQD